MPEPSRVDELLHACFELPETEWRQAASGLCAEHPDLAPEIHKRLAILAAVGFADAALEAPLPAGERLGDYQLLRPLGGGGMGVVYLARHETMGRQVALKLIRGGQMLFPGARERFRREVAAAAKLEHPGVCPIYEAGEIDGMPYIAMRYLAGRTLQERNQERVRQRGASATSRAAGHDEMLECLRVVEDVARTLHAAHEKGLVHRDVKPSNIMLDPDGRPVVLDFGLASDVTSSEHLTQTGALVGTPAYMAPEQVRGTATDRRVDVWGLGVTLYECLTLSCPFAEPSREELYRQILERDPPDPRPGAPWIPKDMWTVLRCALEKDADRRYRTALDLAEDLRRVRCHEPILARPPGLVQRVGAWVRRNRVVASLMVLLGIGMLITGLALRTTLQRNREARADLLASQAAVAAAADQTAALRLAREAVETHASPNTISELQAALARHHERRVLEHAAKVMDAQVAPDGQSFVTACGNRILVWNRRGDCVATGEHEKLVYGTEIANGGRILSRSFDRMATVWRQEGNQLVPIVRIPHPEAVITASFSPRDPELVLTACLDGKARLWRVRGSVVTPGPEFDATSRWLGTALFSPDGELVLTAGFPWTGAPEGFSSPNPRLWGIDGKPRAELRGHQGPILSACFSHDGTRILTASKDRTARIWDLFGHELRCLQGHTDWIVSAAFAPDDRAVVTASRDETARVWPDDGQPAIVLRGHRGGLVGAVFTPSRQVVTAGLDGDLHVWRRNGARLLRVGGHRDQVVGLRVVAIEGISPEAIVSWSFDGTVRVWALVDPELPAFLGHEAELTGAASFPAGSDDVLATSSADATVRIWNARGQETACLPQPGHVQDVVIEPAGKRLVTAGRDGYARRWERRDLIWQPIDEPYGPHGSRVCSLSISPDGKQMLTASDWWEEPLRLWTLGSARPSSFDQCTEVMAVAWAPVRHDEWLVVGPSGPGTQAWRMRAPQQYLHRYGTVSGTVKCVGWSADGERVLTGSNDGTLRVHAREALPDGEPLLTILAHPTVVTSVAFSPRNDGTLLSTSADGTAKLWSSRGDLRVVYRGHEGPVRRALFTPRGDRIVTIGTDGNARSWLVDLEDLLRFVDRRL